MSIVRENKRLRPLLASVLFFSCAPAKAGGLAAFPGAEGFGSRTPGGRGGRVIEVTNVNASGGGSFRAACEARGRRIVMFRVGGVIELRRDVWIREPYITVAAQTAPGEGICIKGAGLRIGTHDVVVRGLRIRVGDDPRGPSPGNRDGIGIENNTTPPYNVIIDHCSVSWAIDETITCWYPCRDITVQWCIASEGLDDSLHPKGRHSKGILIGPNAKRISLHHNIMAHNAQRNPLISANDEVETINNVVYNWAGHGTGIGNYQGPFAVNAVGNYYKRGPNSNLSTFYIASHVPDRSVYLKGNLGPTRRSDSGDEWAVVGKGDKTDGAARSPQPAVRPSGITTQPADQVYHLVLNNAGAVAPRRDTVDRRVVRSIREGTGRIIDSQKEVGGWPKYGTGAPPRDSDHDGMPDDWEVKHGLSPNDATDRNNTAPSGYTWIEKYINSLIKVP